VRSDVFSCGSLLYLLLTGSLPFDGNDVMATLRAVRAARPTPVEQLRPDLPRELCDVVRRAMQPERGERFPSAIAMRAALLEAALAGNRS
jgi:serine/threonine-protein kinase